MFDQYKEVCLIIVDFEATCDDLNGANSLPKHEMEIIEFGAVAVSLKYRSDNRILQQDLNFHGVGNPFIAPQFNFKPWVQNKLNILAKPGWKDVMSPLGLDVEGRAHQAIDDAKNCSNILLSLLNTSD